MKNRRRCGNTNKGNKMLKTPTPGSQLPGIKDPNPRPRVR
jgi:hypothetical protein